MINPLRFTAGLRFAACISLAISMLAAPAISQAALTLNNTRIVFNGDKRSTSVIVKNPSKSTYAVQTWINTVADDTTTAVPFAISPILFKLNAANEQLIQISGLPHTLPNDRESLFFFNLQEIPQASTEPGNQLNIALRTRIKLFYRPPALKGTPAGQLKSLMFSLSEKNGTHSLLVRNPSPFHITFVRLEVSGQGQQHTLNNTDMLEPFAEHAYPLTGIKPAPGLQAQFSVINDYGGYTEPLTLPIHLPN
ncbi:P pilus assembly chaperone PapD [Pseudomonas sp. Y3 TE3536]